MRKLTSIVVLLTAAMAVPAFAGTKLAGDTTLKDLQPAGVGEKHAKKGKHQVFDLTFDDRGKEYVCRTDPDKSVDAVDFVVGSSVHYEVDGKKVKITTPDKKKLECKVVRVAVVPSSAMSAAPASTPQQ